MAGNKARVLVFGTGGVGTMAAYALEIGGKARVTAVLRSNYAAVQKNGMTIDSIEHGHDIKGWRPSESKFTVSLEPFDFVLVTTKNLPEVSPTAGELIEPAVTPGTTAIVLSQNGLNIEKPFVSRFPRNPIISSISTIGATEKPHGVVLHNDTDEQKIGPFHNPGVAPEVAEAAARRYVEIYNACGKLSIVYEHDVLKTRWRKLIYNASFNSVATLLRMDTTRMRMAQHVIDDLIKPIMREIIAAGNAAGADLDPGLANTIVFSDPEEAFFSPSMLQDMEKGNLMEIEVIVGEPLREGEARGVPMPTLKVIYGLLRGLQVRIKEQRGLWEPKFEPGNPYKRR
ncbi:Ketopantoate reductase ApbA/PanE [Niveomyces insectorum RCEF 264]|uniref:2-dehydropantoate 2-reductase n=1 Tax=Niveomyces insectorum RCEF 264 TaxID=1081102 RepID=A0A167W931_9HYPO|nr:Ketopantoate reductase ApbA/PanE [Niveomyces insectorum RCEF 264]